MSAAFTPADFRRLRWSALLLLVLVILGAGAIFVSLQLTKAARAELQQAEAERGDIRTRLGRARDEEQEIRARIARYNDLVARGYIRPEDRLEWVERIAAIKAARKLIDVQYEIAPQRTVDVALLPEGAAGGGYEFMSSTMRLQMQLLHEDDLLGLLADLRGNAPALLVPRGCGIERLPQGVGGGERGIRAWLKADCEIEWITLREKK